MKGFFSRFRRGLALLMALACLLLPCAGLATDLMNQDLIITVQWTDGWGVQASDPAIAIPYDGFTNRYWLKLPAGAPLDGLTLMIEDHTGNYASFEPGSESPLPAQLVWDAGDNLFFGQPVQIMAHNVNGDMTGLYYLYISYQDLPADPYAPVVTEAPVAQPATVVLHYVDENWQPICSDTYQTVNPGSNTVYPDAFIDPGQFQLTGSGSYDVYVDLYGANPAEITFT